MGMSLSVVTFAPGAEELPAAGEKPATEPANPLLATAHGKAAYGIGISIGRQLKQEGIEVADLQSLLLGMQDSLEAHEPRLNEAQFEAAMLVLRNERDAKLSKLGETNKQEGVAFLKKNGARKEVKTLPSGLQYEVLKSGGNKQAASPKATDRVRTHYRGTLIAGTEFDSSYKRGEPAEFGVSEVIPGWTEALQLMKVGDRWRIYLPSSLAYGEGGSPPTIGPNATLIFELELLGIEAGQANPGIPGLELPKK